jgi:hypothetical protein
MPEQNCSKERQQRFRNRYYQRADATGGAQVDLAWKETIELERS